MPRVLPPGTAYKQAKRLNQIISVFLKHGFGEFLDQVRIWEHSAIKRRILHKREKPPVHLSAPQRLRLALEELGPTFVKVGQMLSTRPDIMPEGFILELEKLQNQVAPVSAAVAKGVVKAELGCPVNEVFATFDDKPVAAASLSQVHHATLKSGDPVAVKVQRPDIDEVVETDLEILHSLVDLTQNQLRRWGIHDPVGLAAEFSHILTRELDFQLEAANQKRFGDNFGNIQHIHVPKLYPDLCTRRMVVMEYIEGIGVSDTDRLAAEEYDLSLIAQRCVDVFLKSTLEHGFFHADPHAGNVFILPDNVICPLDYGMMGTVSFQQREKLAWLLYHLSRLDEKRVTRALLELSESSGALVSEKLQYDVANLILEYGHLSLSELHLSLLLSQLWKLMTSHGLSLQPHLVWLLKAVATGEDIAHRLDADFNLVEYSTPYVRHLLRRSLSPRRQARELEFAAIDLLNLLKDLPFEARDILRQVRAGRFKVEFEHAGLRPLRQTLNQATNRLALAVILASLLIGSSLMLLSHLPPLVFGLPIIGLAGYLISGLLGIWLVISILWTRSK